MNPVRLRIVLDTSSLVSYILTRGEIMTQIIVAWRSGEIDLITSPETVLELRAVISRPEIQERSVVPLHPFAEGLEKFSIHVPGELKLHGVCRDPKDDKFVASAVEGRAHYLVSSDRDLLELGRCESICILNPGQFLAALHLARLPVEALWTQYSLEGLQAILSGLCLDAETREKLVRAIAHLAV
jgi:putative PIN family toxin of toxin-antitoxin system